MFMSAQPQIHRARRISRLVRAVPAGHGAGVKLNRVIGTEALDHVDPILMFEEFSFDAPAYDVDLPGQPYRGFETLTYMLKGGLRYGDNHDQSGEVEPGGAVWMNAGRGIVHSEVPASRKDGVHGIRLWLNLPAGLKMTESHYSGIAAEDIPAVIFKTAEVGLLAGRFHGLIGPVTSSATQPFIADVILPRDGEVTLMIPEDHQGFIYVFEGGVAVEKSLINPGQAGLLEAGNVLNLVAGASGARAIIVTAKPLNEPVVRHGPFVMNTQAEIKQAFVDYRNGNF